MNPTIASLRPEINYSTYSILNNNNKATTTKTTKITETCNINNNNNKYNSRSNNNYDSNKLKYWTMQTWCDCWLKIIASTCYRYVIYSTLTRCCLIFRMITICGNKLEEICRIFWWWWLGLWAMDSNFRFENRIKKFLFKISYAWATNIQSVRMKPLALKKSFRCSLPCFWKTALLYLNYWKKNRADIFLLYFLFQLLNFVKEHVCALMQTWDIITIFLQPLSTRQCFGVTEKSHRKLNRVCFLQYGRTQTFVQLKATRDFCMR